jgi:hypothetical protein
MCDIQDKDAEILPLRAELEKERVAVLVLAERVVMLRPGERDDELSSALSMLALQHDREVQAHAQTKEDLQKCDRTMEGMSRQYADTQRKLVMTQQKLAFDWLTFNMTGF